MCNSGIQDVLNCPSAYNQLCLSCPGRSSPRMGPQEVVAVQSYLSECTKICLYLFMKKKKKLIMSTVYRTGVGRASTQTG